jgi:hypothetical protein
MAVGVGGMVGAGSVVGLLVGLGDGGVSVCFAVACSCGRELGVGDAGRVELGRRSGEQATTEVTTSKSPAITGAFILIAIPPDCVCE